MTCLFDSGVKFAGAETEVNVAPEGGECRGSDLTPRGRAIG